MTYELLVSLDDTVGQALALGALEAPTWTLTSLCSPGDEVIDVGANVGYTALAAAGVVGPRGRVVALEPGSANFELLSKNADQAANVTVVRAAAGATDGSAVLTTSKTSGDTSSLRADRVLGERTNEQVRLVTLSSLCNAEGIAPDVVKVDVEGGEWDVLCGLLPAVRPRVLLVEANWQATAAFGYKPSEMCDWLMNEAYELQMLDGSTYSALEVDNGPTADVVARLET